MEFYITGFVGGILTTCLIISMFSKSTTMYKDGFMDGANSLEKK